MRLPWLHHQLPLEKQQEVLTFVDSLRSESPAKIAEAPSLEQIAALPLAERHRLLQPHLSAMTAGFRTEPAVTEFSILDGEDWELEND